MFQMFILRNPINKGGLLKVVFFKLQKFHPSHPWWLNHLPSCASTFKTPSASEMTFASTPASRAWTEGDGRIWKLKLYSEKLTITHIYKDFQKRHRIKTMFINVPFSIFIFSKQSLTPDFFTAKKHHSIPFHLQKSACWRANFNTEMSLDSCAFFRAAWQISHERFTSKETIQLPSDAEIPDFEICPSR